MSQLNQNAQNWLNMISFAEGTWRADQGGRQYNIMYGGGRFNDLSRHPDTVIDGGRYKSAAAGAYQFMPGTWRGIMGGAMTPERQDQAAYLLARRRGVDLNTAPFTRENVALLAPEWASLPTMQGVSYYGQPVKSFESLTNFSNMTPPQGQYNAEEPTPRRSQNRDLTAAEMLLLNEQLQRSAERQRQIEERLKGLNRSRIKSGLVNNPGEEDSSEQIAVIEQPVESRESMQGRLLADVLKSATESGDTSEGIRRALLSAQGAFRGGKSVI